MLVETGINLKILLQIFVLKLETICIGNTFYIISVCQALFFLRCQYISFLSSLSSYIYFYYNQK